MLREERLANIVKFIDSHRFASLDTLVELLGKSCPTVRRDLNELASQGRIKLVRGGAMSVINESVVYAEPFGINRADDSDISMARQRVAAAAVEQIAPGDSIFLCSGRTTREMSGLLKNLAPLKVVTNDFHIANDLFLCPGISVMICGGDVISNRMVPCTSGYVAEDFVNTLQIDKLFLSCDSFKINSGCYIANPSEIGMMRSAIKVSSTCIVMATHEKFNQNGFVSVCGIDDIDLIISDNGLSTEIRSYLKNVDLKLICV